MLYVPAAQRALPRKVFRILLSGDPLRASPLVDLRHPPCLSPLRTVAAVLALTVVSATGCGTDLQGPAEGAMDLPDLSHLPVGATVLTDLAFGTPEIDAGDSTIVYGVAAGREAVRETVRLSTTEGAELMLELVPTLVPDSTDPESWIHCGDGEKVRRSYWSRCTNAQIAAYLARIGNWTNALIAFKEADQERGVDRGVVLVSDSTVQFMKEWIEQVGISIEYEYVLSPTVAVHVPIDLELIGVVRGDPRIDYFEPNVSGCPWFGPCLPSPNLLVGVVDLSNLNPSPGPGTSLIAEYRQPRDSVLKAEIVVR